MCSKSDTKKVEKVQERALYFIYRKFESDYKSLLNLAERSSLYMDRLRTIVTLTLLHLSSVYISYFHWYLLYFSYYHTSWTKSTCACVNCFYCLQCKIKIVLLSYSLTERLGNRCCLHTAMHMSTLNAKL